MTNRFQRKTLLAAALFCSTLGAHAQQTTEPETSQRVVVTGQKNASGWFKAVSQHFIVFSNTSNNDVRQLLDNMEKLDYVLRLYTRDFISANSSRQKMTLYYHDGVLGFDAAVQDEPAEAVGLYNSCGAGVQGYGVQLERVESLNNQQLARHALNDTLSYAFAAYARHFLYRHTDIRSPSSYIDGFAQYFSALRFTDNQMSVGRVPRGVSRYIYFLDSGHSYRLLYRDILDQPEATDPLPAERLEFLAKSWVLTHYMMSSAANQSKLGNYLNLVHQDVPTGKAFEDAFGVKVADLDNAMWRYRLKGVQVTQVEIPELPVASIEFTSLPEAVTDFVLADAALTSCPDKKTGLALLRTVTQHPAGVPNNDAARLTVSRARINWGNAEDALPYLTEAARRDGGDVQALTLLGLANLRLAEQHQDARRAAYLQAASEHLSRARGLAPRSAEAAYALYQVRMRVDAQPGQQALEAAIAAWHNAHEVNQYARAAALALAYLGRAPEADNALTLLAHNARDPDMARWAKTWQARLATSVARADLVAEMRNETAGTFKEWTIDSDGLMQTVEQNAGIEDSRRYLDAMRLSNPISERNQFSAPSRR
jgi:hypothetical protein